MVEGGHHLRKVPDPHPRMTLTKSKVIIHSTSSYIVIIFAKSENNPFKTTGAVELTPQDLPCNTPFHWAKFGGNVFRTDGTITWALRSMDK